MLPRPQLLEKWLFFQLPCLVCLPVNSKSFVERFPFSFWKNQTVVGERVESEAGSPVGVAFIGV